MKFCLGKINYIVMGIAALMIVVGFILTWGDPSSADQYNPDVFSFRRVVVGPNICFLGYVMMIVGIIVPNRKK